MHRLWPVLLLVALSGCTDSGGHEDQATYRDTVVVDGEEVEVENGPAASGAPASDVPGASPELIVVAGTVHNQAGQPIERAVVTILELNRSRLTGPDGRFAFDDVEPALYVLEARADGYLGQRLTFSADREPPLFLLAPDRTARPPVTIAFNGLIQCALEVAIISPSCDSAITSDQTIGGPAIFTSDSIALVVVEPGWSTLVVDAIFDDASHPGLDGLRFTVRGTEDDDQFLGYTEYGKFFTRDGPTFRIEPGGEYLEGDRPVPEQSAAFEVETFPNGHFWHPGGAGFLGVGASIDVEFTLYLTTFYGEPAPDGWTFLA